jgi:hypothetical protein
MPQPPFPEVVDSTMISTFRACGRKFELEYLHHWRPKMPNVHLHAGKAFAEGLEVARKAFYDNGESEEEAIARGMGALLKAYGSFECPEDSPKSADRMAAAFEYTMSQYRMDDPTIAAPIVLPSGKRAIEFSFVEPLDFPHPVTGQPILFSGRFDMIVNFAGGAFGEDDKTTSSLGASWSKQWDLRSQFTAYCWGANKGGLNLQGFLVRGTSILKTKFDTQQAITYRPSWMIDRWYNEVMRNLEDMVLSWKSGQWAYNLDESCNSYGGCIFRKVCLSQDADTWLRADFERRRWDPVHRIEIPIIEEPV